MLTDLINLTKGLFASLPASISIVLSLLVLALSFYLYNRKVGIEEKNSESAVQATQVESLLAQITLLSAELDKTRKQLSELHAQNIQLMDELRKANLRISELELFMERRGQHIMHDDESQP